MGPHVLRTTPFPPQEGNYVPIVAGNDYISTTIKSNNASKNIYLLNSITVYSIKDHSLNVYAIPEV